MESYKVSFRLCCLLRVSFFTSINNIHDLSIFLKRYTKLNSPSVELKCLIYVGLPDSLIGKESTCNAGDPSSILGLGRS